MKKNFSKITALVVGDLMLDAYVYDKKNRKSQLDQIEGIGGVLKKRLLLNFKSLKNIKSANIEDLMTVKGINAKIAQIIKEKL